MSKSRTKGVADTAPVATNRHDRVGGLKSSVGTRELLRAILLTDWDSALESEPEGSRGRELFENLLGFLERGVLRVNMARLEKEKEAANSPWWSIFNAVKKLGRHAQAKTILAEAKVSNKAGRDALRQMANLGFYTGHTKDRPARYSRPS